MAEEPIVTPTATPTPTPTPVVVTPPMVSIPLDQLQAFTGLQARLAQMDAENRQRETAANEERIRILTEKNDAITAVKTLRDAKDAELKTANDARVGIEDRAKRYALDGELARVLASQPIVPGSAAQLMSLFRAEFQVHAEGDSFTVRTPTFQSVEQFVKEKLAHVDYAHFVRATNPAGGTAGTTGGDRAAPTGDAAKVEAPKNYGEAIILHMKEQQKAAGADPRLNLRLPMGLSVPG
jgi:hypothetical protein